LYLKYFGFREEPFNLTPDPKFFYSSDLHREALAALYYGVRNKKGFVVVTGEVGTGKTTLLRKLLRSLEATHHSVFIFNTQLAFDELLESILRDLNIRETGAGRVAMLERLNEFLLEKIRVGHVVSVLIDEAQNLTEDVLEGVRLLSNMETDREKLIQIILVGQPELEATLNRPALRQLKQRVSLWCRLDCLSAADTEKYIRHRLDVAGYQGPDIFDPTSIRLICEHAAGTPRLINSICDNALLTAFAGSQKIVGAKIIYEVIQDLRLTRESDIANLIPERKGTAQLPPKAVRNMPELGDARGKTKGGSQEEPLERFRNARGIRTSGAADVVYNLRSDHGDGSGIAFERDFKRAPARNVSIMAEAKHRMRAGERLDEWEENTAVDVDSTERDFFLSGHETARQHVNDTFVPAAFFAKMTQALTDAMGPMASVVFKDRIARLGESVEEFPIIRLPELIAAIKQEILNEPLRLRFEVETAEQIQEHSRLAVPRSSTE